MTAPRITLTEQREAVEALLTDEIASEATVRAGRQAALTLGWLERREELIREVARLDCAAPELLALLKQIPGLQIVGVNGTCTD